MVSAISMGIGEMADEHEAETATTRVPAPSTEAGRELLSWWDEHRFDFPYPEAAIIRIEEAARAEGRREAVREPHGTHTPCCGWPAEHKWADPIRCMKCHEDWPCSAALAGLNAEQGAEPQPSESPPTQLIDGEREPIYDHDGIALGDASESPPAREMDPADGGLARTRAIDADPFVGDASESGHAPGCRMPGCEGECRDASESGQPPIVPPGIDPATGMRYRPGDDPMEVGPAPRRPSDE